MRFLLYHCLSAFNALIEKHRSPFHKGQHKLDSKGTEGGHKT